MDPPAAWRKMQIAVRNLGREGLAATAISAVDIALWDLKAVLLDRPLASILGRYRESVPIYGSGGFTSYDDGRLARQLSRLGRERGVPLGQDEDRKRPCTRSGPRCGCKDGDRAGRPVRRCQRSLRSQAGDPSGRRFSLKSRTCSGSRSRFHRMILRAFGGCVTRRRPSWRSRPASTATVLDYFRRMLQAGAVDVQQADATRCGGVTGFPASGRSLRSASHRSFCSLRARAPSSSAVARLRDSAIWNGFTTMSASNTCCSTARLCRIGAALRPIHRVLASA